MAFGLVVAGPLSWAANIEIKRGAHFTHKNYSIDGGKKQPLECEAYADRSKEGIKAQFKFNAAEYGLECKGQEAGSSFNLVMMDGSKWTSKIENLVTSGGDCSDYFESQVWFEDLNKDKHLDVYRLAKSKFVPGCEPGEPSLNEASSIYYWQPATKDFKEVKVTAAELKKFSKKFQFKF
jgi:hypothetical protein